MAGLIQHSEPAGGGRRTFPAGGGRAKEWRIFHRDGKVTTDFFGGNDAARAIRLQVDGRVVLAGNADRPAAGSPNSLLSVDFALVRYNLDGTLDASFGSGGKVASNLLGNIEFALAL